MKLLKILFCFNSSAIKFTCICMTDKYVSLNRKHVYVYSQLNFTALCPVSGLQKVLKKDGREEGRKEGRERGREVDTPPPNTTNELPIIDRSLR